MWFYDFDDLVHVFVVDICKLETEISTKEDRNLVSLESTREVCETLLKLIGGLINGCEGPVEHSLKVGCCLVEGWCIKIAWGFIVSVKEICKDRMPSLNWLAGDTFIRWFPVKLDLLVFDSVIPHFIIHPCKGKSLKTHSLKEFRSYSWVAKCIQVPRMFRHNSECLFQEGMTR